MFFIAQLLDIASWLFTFWKKNRQNLKLRSKIWTKIDIDHLTPVPLKYFCQARTKTFFFGLPLALLYFHIVG